MNVNRVMMAGNLTRDPTIRQTPSGAQVGSLTVALNDTYRTRQNETREEVAFVDVEVWGKQADACGQYLKKGAPVFVEGKLRTSEWEDRQTGQKRSRMLVRAERVQFLPGNGERRQS